MREPRVRVLVGEGQPARRGLFRFVLENEGYDVVAEAASTMELAQQLAIHRPDVVVLDDGIDVGAVGILREVQPSAKLILVWPRGVAAVGADARLEPAEVMHALGSTVARVTGGDGGVITLPPDRPRVPVPDLIVVPEPEVSAPTPATPAPTAASPAPIPATPEATVFPPAIRSSEAPRWTYAAPSTSPPPRRSIRAATAVTGLVIGGLLVGLAVALTLGQSRTIDVRSLTGDVGEFRFPEQEEVTFTEPGTYAGAVSVQAQGSIRVRASGDVVIRLEGTSRVVARGDVKVRGEGVVRNSSGDTAVRIRGSGTVRLTVGGAVRLRVEGSLFGSVDGSLRIGGNGTFLIHRRLV